MKWTCKIICMVAFAAAHSDLVGADDVRLANIIEQGDFDTSDCRDQKCLPWELSGAAMISYGPNSATSEQALGFGTQLELGTAQQTISISPGTYKLQFRFHKTCVEGLHIFLVVSIGSVVVFTRVFESNGDCGWQKLEKVIKLQSAGRTDFVMRVRSFELGKPREVFLIDSVELVKQNVGAD